FTGGDRQVLLRQIAFEEPTPPRRLNKAIPAELETIVLKAMEKNPTDRYDSARGLADDLERFLKDEPIRAKRPTLMQRARKWARRHQPVVWSGAAALLAIVAGIAGGGGWGGRGGNARMTEAAQQAKESLTRARTWVAEDNLASARQELAEAKGRIGDHRAALEGLAEEIEALEAELAKLERFLQLVDRAHEAEI